MKMKRINFVLIMLSGIIILSCTGKNKKESNMESYEKGTFGYDLDYLSQKDEGLITLSGNGGESQLIISPKYQAKVFTSTASGLAGKSLGYINYKFFDAGVVDEHMNGFGGENRFWLGPEGGRFSVYFEKGTQQVYDNWFTPKPIDIEPWDVIAKSEKTASLKKEMEVRNYLGNQFRLQADRTLTLLDRNEIVNNLSIELNPNVKTVGYVSDNSIVNRNDFEWTKETGTICIWILDMFNPAPRAVTIIPFNEGSEEELGKIVTSDYFGEIPADRLKIQGSNIYLKTDGNFRSKLGLTGKRTKAIAGNYDPDLKRLTVTVYDVDENAVYLNQEWNPDKDPMIGDAMNAYNDGPLEDGSIMGPFLELESVSPAAFLKPGESLKHKHTVYHFMGEEAELNLIAEKLLGVSIEEIKNVF